jgi:hypothetical protein
VISIHGKKVVEPPPFPGPFQIDISEVAQFPDVQG